MPPRFQPPIIGLPTEPPSLTPQPIPEQPTFGQPISDPRGYAKGMDATRVGPGGVGSNVVMSRLRELRRLDDKRVTSRNKALLTTAKTGFKVAREDNARTTAMMTHEGRERYSGIKGFKNWMSDSAKIQESAVQSGIEAEWTPTQREWLSNRMGIKGGLRGLMGMNKEKWDLPEAPDMPDAPHPDPIATPKLTTTQKVAGMIPGFDTTNPDELAKLEENLKLQKTQILAGATNTIDAPPEPMNPDGSLRLPHDNQAVIRARYAEGVEQEIFPKETTIEDWWKRQSTPLDAPPPRPTRPEIPLDAEVEDEMGQLYQDPDTGTLKEAPFGTKQSILDEIEETNLGYDPNAPTEPALPVDPASQSREALKKQGVDLTELFGAWDSRAKFDQQFKDFHSIMGKEIESGVFEGGSLGKELDTSADTFGVMESFDEMFKEGAGGEILPQALEGVKLEGVEEGLKAIGIEMGAEASKEVAKEAGTELASEVGKEAGKEGILASAGPAMDVISLFDEDEREIGDLVGKGIKAGSMFAGPFAPAVYGVGMLVDMLS